jgi:hypothetical protein
MLLAVPVTAQIPDDVLTFTREAIEAERDEPIPFIETPPTEWDTWTPEVGQFRLYVNYDVLTNPFAVKDTVPRIDVLGKDGSWPYVMVYDLDTLFIFLVPPGYTLPRGSIASGIPMEFPLVVLAGTNRAVYWFSNDGGELLLDPLEPSDFLTIAPILPLPKGCIVLLQQSNLNSKMIAKVMERVAEVDSTAALVQLDEGFYESAWPLIRQVTIQRWKVNQVWDPMKKAMRILLVIQVTSEFAPAVQAILISSPKEVYAIAVNP